MEQWRSSQLLRCYWKEVDGVNVLVLVIYIEEYQVFLDAVDESRRILY